MNFKGLKKKTAEQYCNNQLRKLKKSGVEAPKKIETIGVLANSRLFGSYDISRNLSQKLGMPSKCFEILIYENLKDDFVTQHYNTFSEKDFGMFAKIKAHNVQGFVETKYDMFINYCNSESVFTNVIAIRVNSNFKISFADSKMHDLYSFMIEVNSNEIDIFNDELAKYLRILSLI